MPVQPVRAAARDDADLRARRAARLRADKLLVSTLNSASESTEGEKL